MTLLYEKVISFYIGQETKKRPNDGWSHCHVSKNHVRNYFEMVKRNILSSFNSYYVYVVCYKFEVFFNSVTDSGVVNQTVAQIVPYLLLRLGSSKLKQSNEGIEHICCNPARGCSKLHSDLLFSPPAMGHGHDRPPSSHPLYSAAPFGLAGTLKFVLGSEKNASGPRLWQDRIGSKL